MGDPSSRSQRTSTAMDRYSRGPRRISYAAVAMTVLGLIPQVASAYTPTGRWGHATTLISNSLYVHGGKVDPSNTYSYSSAPNTNDLLSLDLSSSFSLATPPWRYCAGSQDNTTSQGPTVAFHTLSPVSSSQILLFGGSGGPTMPIETGSDSAWLLDVSESSKLSWISQAAGWASQPMRSMYHAAACTSDGVWILGGMKADGSLTAFGDTYNFQLSTPSFSTLIQTVGSFPVYGHALITLPSGLLLSIGGFSSSQNSLVAFSELRILDPSSPNPQWANVNATGDIPTPRRGFAATLLEGDKVLIHGGADSALQTVYGDGAILDTTQMPMVWSSAPNLSQLGPRYDHSAIGIRSQVLFSFGYTSSGPASSSLMLYDVASGAFVSTFTPSPVSTATSPSSTASRPPSTTHHGSPTPTGTLKPSVSSPADSNGDAHGGDKPSVTKIVVAAVLGVLGLVALISGAAYYVIRRNEHQHWHRGEGSGALMGRRPGERDRDDGYSFGNEKPPMAGTRWNAKPGWSLLGLGSASAAGKQRFNMLEDEDREFAAVRAPGDESTSRIESRTHRHEHTGSSDRPTWGELYHDSVTSLVSLGSLVGRKVSSKAQPQWWNETDPFEDPDGMTDRELGLEGAGGSMPLRTRGDYPPSSFPTQTVYYRDPFADPYSAEAVPLTGNQPERHDQDSTEPSSISRSSLGPSLFQTDPTTSVSSHDPPLSALSNTNTAATSRTSHDASPQKPTFETAPIVPVARSDSWWARLSRSAFSPDPSFTAVTPRITRLGFRNSAPQPEPLNFRDPAPPPRLPPVAESSLSPETTHANPMHSRLLSLRHGRSLSSVQTADTAALEQYGNEMEVVRHVHTRSTYETDAPRSDSRPRLSLRLANRTRSSMGSADYSFESASHEEEPLPIVTSPVPLTAVVSPFADSQAEVVAPPRPVARRKQTGEVAARVAAYERRMTEEKITSPPLSPRKPTSAGATDAAPTPLQKNRANWGLSQRPELFIANPDNRLSSGASLAEAIL